MKNQSGDVGTGRIRLVGVTLGLCANGAMAAPGDLDPAFGDVGRVSDLGFPALWSIDVADDGDIAFGGGVDYCWYYTCEYDASFGRLLSDGTPDATFAAAKLATSVIYDTALQPDGKLVAVGRQIVSGQERLVVVRLQPNGALDAGFATAGVFLLPDSGIENESARSVLLEDDGRIVVLGNRGMGIVVVRLTPAGALDASFGTGGIAKPGEGFGFPRSVAHAPGAGYRLLANVAVDPTVESRSKCYVFGLTEAGAPDATYGTDGRVLVSGLGYQTCSDFAVDTDGAIVLGGNGGFLARLLASGAPDPTFVADALADRLGTVGAIRLGSGGRIFVAGTAPDGLAAATVVRLLADGTLDTLFGTGGVSQFVVDTWAQLPHALQDMKVIDGDALVLGGNSNYGFGGFAARLLGDDAGSGPGIVTISDGSVFATEAEGEATVHVRRLGGSAGAVTFNYAAQTANGQNAVAGQDYTAVTGSLRWEDGESDEREITIPILADAVEEGQETFELTLQSRDGEAGFGVRSSSIVIAGAAYPYGTVNFQSGVIVTEGVDAQIQVDRFDYCSGEISVTVHLAGGTAENGVDFKAQDGSAWSDVTLTWADGECASKIFVIKTVADDDREPAESVTLQLTSPGGGALVGAQAEASVSIRDPVQRNRGSGGGGGALGGLGAVLLGLIAALRRHRGRAPAA